MNKKVSDQKISESDIRAIYHQGEDAVVELVTRLIERIERLEERLDKDSRNSSKPPSGDGFGKRTKSLHILTNFATPLEGNLAGQMAINFATP
ncbi:hypothetical protein I1H34_13665 [Acaryochloris marina S15]|nr:DUF6444 domain-containing protein [Acaryochloris marina]QUY40430.1 hypothetical protein I1H34_13660 [Acaryochloris marina S15]QUY40431.1 hypothetical protein I1H34_13665 [Acaryochloris marina S15]